jgi:oligoribonuclease
MDTQETPKGPLIWIDLEMSGLIIETDVILEIATVVTDNQLEIIAQGPNLTIGQPEQILNAMNDWCKEHHGKSGLTQESRNSTITVEQAQEATINFLQPFAMRRQGVLCGNSVWQDRVFLRKYMPRVYELFHYKIIDVSSIKEVIRRWYPNSPYKEFEKKDTHRALPDILESIDELRHYRSHFFVSGS